MARTMLKVALQAGLAVVVSCGLAYAHCDALDGPVVKAARAALDSRDVTKVLPWVAAAGEAEVRAAFDRALEVRALGAEARALADTWFFETVVRIHRAGEGAAFEGLKPAGHIDPFLVAVDETLETGVADDLLAKVTALVGSGLRERFLHAREARTHAGESVDAGRRFVAAYVDYVHYAEAIHQAALGTNRPRHGEPATGHQHPQ